MLIVSLTDIWFVSRYICLIHRLLDDTEIISGYVSWYVDCYLLCKYLADRSRVTCFRQSIRAFSSAQYQKVTSFWVIHNYGYSANLDLNWRYFTYYLNNQTDFRGKKSCQQKNLILQKKRRRIKLFNYNWQCLSIYLIR